MINGSIKIHGLSLKYEWAVEITHENNDLISGFGINPESLVNHVCRDLSCSIHPGEVVYITGPSGTGKTTFLKMFLRINDPDLIMNGSIEFPDNYKSLEMVELPSDSDMLTTLGDKDVAKGLQISGKIGLNDALVLLKRFKHLSAGQKYRAMMATLINSDANVWVCDEFCSFLDTLTANLIAHKMQSAAREAGVTLILASAHCEGWIRSLKPDKVIMFRNAFDYDILDADNFYDKLRPVHALRAGIPLEDEELEVGQMVVASNGKPAKVVRKNGKKSLKPLTGKRPMEQGSLFG